MAMSTRKPQAAEPEFNCNETRRQRCSPRQGAALLGLTAHTATPGGRMHPPMCNSGSSAAS